MSDKITLELDTKQAHILEAALQLFKEASLTMRAFHWNTTDVDIINESEWVFKAYVDTVNLIDMLMKARGTYIEIFRPLTPSKDEVYAYDVFLSRLRNNAVAELNLALSDSDHHRRKIGTSGSNNCVTGINDKDVLYIKFPQAFHNGAPVCLEIDIATWASMHNCLLFSQEGLDECTKIFGNYIKGIIY